jgi:hypothetical protein
LNNRIFFYEKRSKTTQETGATRSRIRFLHTDQSVASWFQGNAAEDSYGVTRRSLDGSNAVIHTIDNLHAVKPLVCEVCQSVLMTVLELLRTLNCSDSNCRTLGCSLRDNRGARGVILANGQRIARGQKTAYFVRIRKWCKKSFASIAVKKNVLISSPFQSQRGSYIRRLRRCMIPIRRGH